MTAAPPSRFAAVLREYWRLNPIEATRAGIHEFDTALPDFGPDGLAERRAWRAATRADLTTQRFGVADELDRRVLLAELDGQQIDDEWQIEQRSPALYIEQAMQGLDALLARPDTTVSGAQRAERLRSRLDRLPSLLAQGRANLSATLVPPAFVDIALVACDEADRFLSGLPEAAAARQAVAEFAAYLRTELQPGGTFALGHDLFARLLQHKHGLTLTPDEVYDRGANLANELRAQLDRLGDWRAQIEQLKIEHPQPETLLQTYAAEAARARAFVEDHHLVPIPPGERFEVRPTAPFRRATMPLGHFDKAPPFASDDNLGILYITPVDTALPAERQRELLEAHCFTAVRAICLHESFPGHHVQLWHARLRGSDVRRQFPSPLFVEGWALYCEELLDAAGYYDSPGLQLWRLKNEMWRAVRLMVDVGLHCRGLSVESAAQPLVELGGLEPRTALGEALRYTTSPTQPSSYVLGRDRILELRGLAEQRPSFDLYTFHDWLLGYGSMSPPFIPDPV